MKRKAITKVSKPTGQSAYFLKESDVDVEESCMRKKSNQATRSRKPDSWHDFFHGDLRPTDDFMANCTDLPIQKR